MADTFDSCGIFEIADQIERNGAAFYRRAAEIFDDDTICDTLLRLADWEVDHARVFAGMKERLSALRRTAGTSRTQRTVTDPRAMAGLAVFGIRSDPSAELKGHESKTDILKRAIQKEKESITFYEGLKDFATDNAARDKIDEVIEQEMGHIEILDELLK